MKKFLNLSLPVFIMVLAVAADLISKRMIAGSYELGDRVPIIGNVLNMFYVTNTGAAFGILKDHRWIFISVSTAAILVIGSIFVFVTVKKKALLMRSAIALMLGGGIGNMAERVYLGYVVDFLEFDFIDFAIFNFADVFVCVGSALFVIAVLIDDDNIFLEMTHIFSSNKKHKKEEVELSGADNAGAAEEFDAAEK